MKSIVLRALGAAAVAVCLSGNVYAQASDTGAAAVSAPAAANGGGKAAAKADAKAARKANRKLGYAVRKAISKQSGVDVSNLVVRSKGGVVSLQGTMPDTSQIDKAAAAAKTVPGVTSVVNKLTVQQQ
ncbi:BON domain-containing protein [Burkholderia guangdongensis]|uniref:BON domain-containing protein n=1 Tax=Burkholderia guangdongensis TaxID=1792500 RepID=UPI0015C9E638|nr:BON domain-containing protein [Burkholderia guangdongensis]